MSALTKERMLDLMAFVDGELEDGERDAMARLVATDEDAAAFVRDLDFLGDHVRAASGAAPAIDVADAVMAAVAREADPTNDAAPAERVVELDPRRLQTARRQVSRGPMLIAALALAASVFFLVRSKHGDAPIAPVSPIAQVMTVTTPSSVVASDLGAQARAALESSEVEVEAVESPEQSVSVFYLPSGSELSSSVVVWVDEKEEK